jgi:nitroreductase
VDFKNILIERKSIRHFSSKNIDDELIKEILTDACWAPSPGNSQLWKTIVLSQQATQKVINKFEIKAWEHIFFVLKSMLRVDEIEKKNSFNLNAESEKTFYNHIKVSGLPRMVIIYRNPTSLRDYFNLFKSSVSMFLFRVKKIIGLINKIKYFFQYLINIYQTFRIANATHEAALDCFSYAVTLAAYNRGVVTCLQWTYNGLYKKVYKLLGIHGPKIHCVVLIGYKAEFDNSSEDMLLKPRSRNKPHIQWIK